MTRKTYYTFETLHLPRGFAWGAAKAAIKKEGRYDVAVMVADKTCAAAATFTQNAFAAAPVILSKKNICKTNGKVRAILANSGIANAATGEEGMKIATQTAQQLAELTHSSADEIIVCSTGTIGVQLPDDRMKSGIDAACADVAPDVKHFENFVRAIMTTDTVPKAASEQFDCNGKKVSVLGCSKGSGMIRPMMATMLGFIATDAEIDPVFLDEIFKRCVEHSFNCLTVDGDTSTNDTCIVMASGASGVEIKPNSCEALYFETALQNVMQSLAKQMARDGEGATKLVEVCVKQARTFEEARTIAQQIANSPLVKTAIYGKDANWGRIACAIGNAPVAVDPRTICIFLGDLEMFHNGQPLDFDEAKALEILDREEIHIDVTLELGTQEATVWTCDLTDKYIEINGCYRT